MVAEETNFDISYSTGTGKVVEHSLKGKRIWRICFTDNRKPLVITVALTNKEEKFWTSIPEGRQQEAEEIGKLIAAHIRSKRKLNQ